MTQESHPYTELPVIPAVGGEESLLLAFLDYQRAVVRRKAEGLTLEQMGQCITGHPSPLTVGGILKHLSWVEKKWALVVFKGKDYSEIGEPWATQRGSNPDWEWSLRKETSESILKLYDEAVRDSRHALSTVCDLSTLSKTAGCSDPGEAVADEAPQYELRWILLHLLEEYARHAGHLDLLRERLDGEVGN